MPSFALAVALGFWGWRSDQYGAAAALALLAEGARFVRLRFELRHADFSRIADLCTVLFVGLLVLLLVAEEPPRTARAVLTAMLWLPVVLVPIVLAQRYSTAGRVPLSALFRYLRKLRARDPNYRETALDVDPIYFVVCLASAGIPNERDPYFYGALALVVAWALVRARPSHAPRSALVASLGAAVVLGYGAYAGLGRAQAALEDWMSDWYLRGMNSDPYRSSTDLGALGRLKMIDTIVLRVYAGPEFATPTLLHRASFNVFDGNAWIARQAPMTELQPLADGTSWEIARGTPSTRLRIFIHLEHGNAMLALPQGTLRLSDMAAAKVRHNSLGALQAQFGGDWAPYSAERSTGAGDYAAPREEDLQLPEPERSTLERLAADLRLTGLPPAQAVARIRKHFAGFRYATYRERPVPAGTTALADFLLRSKSGHCEYFAAATTLLLRAAGVPARYATGFAVYEYSALERAYVARARHAHAWARAYVEGRWLDIDTTPPSWTEEEERLAPAWQRLSDLLRWAAFRWAQRGALEAGIGWAALVAALIAFLAWRLLRGKRAALRATAALKQRAFAGADSEFYALEARLAARGAARAPHESLGVWLARIRPSLEHALYAALAQATRLHERYRFDPIGLDAAQRQHLAEQCRLVSARLESLHG